MAATRLIGSTVMIKNIPRWYTAREVVGEMDKLMGREAFDFVHVTWAENSTTNTGLALVNFCDQAVADAASAQITGMSWSESEAIEPFVVTAQPAYVQGLLPNLRRFWNLRRLHEECGDHENSILQHMPLIFEDGVEIVFEVALVKYGLVEVPLEGAQPHSQQQQEEKEQEEQLLPKDAGVVPASSPSPLHVQHRRFEESAAQQGDQGQSRRDEALDQREKRVQQENLQHEQQGKQDEQHGHRGPQEQQVCQELKYMHHFGLAVGLRPYPMHDLEHQEQQRCMFIAQSLIGIDFFEEEDLGDSTCDEESISASSTADRFSHKGELAKTYLQGTSLVVNDRMIVYCF